MFFYLSKLFNFFFNPLFYVGLTYCIGLFWLKQYKKPFRLFLALGIYVFIISSPLCLAPIHLWEHDFVKVEDQTADAVMILGGGSIYYQQAQDQFILGSNFSRFLEGARLHQKIKSKYLIISGGDPHALPEGIEKESLSSAKYFKEIGIPSEQILIENQSLNTYQEAVLIKPLLEKHQIKNLYLVTDAIHMKRSLKIFEKQGIVVKPYPVNNLVHPLNFGFHWNFGNIGKLYLFIHELAGVLVYKIMGYI